MFKLAETVPSVFPAATVVLRGTVGPVVWAEAPHFDAMVALNQTELWDAVTVGLPILSDNQKLELIRLCGGVPLRRLEEEQERAERAESQLLAQETLANAIIAAGQQLAPMPAAEPEPAAA